MRLLDIYKYIHNEDKVLREANLKQLYTQTLNETPKVAGRGKQLITKVRYFGLSEDGTLNFKVNSQTVPGRYYYMYIEAPDILRFGDILEQGDHFNQADLSRLLTMNGFRVHSNDPSFLYWSFQYKATQGNYEIEPETRAPKRNNTTLKGALNKHLFAVIENLYNNNKMREVISRDIDNYLRMLNNMDYEDYQQMNHARQIQQQNRSVKWKNNPTDYMNGYFARQAKHHDFLDDHDIKKSLRKEVTKFVRANPESSTDEFLRSYFNMTQKAFAEDMQIPENSVTDYFEELGFTKKQDKWKERTALKQQELVKQEELSTQDVGQDVQPDGEDTDALLKANILNKDSEQLTGNILKESSYYKDVTNKELNSNPVQFVYYISQTGERVVYDYPNVTKLFDDIMNAYGGFKQFKGTNWAIVSNYKDGEFYLIRDPYHRGGWKWEDVNGDIVDPVYRSVRGLVEPEASPLEKKIFETSYVLYHGTDSKFDSFDLSKAGKNSRNKTYGQLGKGLYFTPSLALAKQYGKNILKAKVELNNPFDMDAWGYEDLFEEIVEDIQKSPKVSDEAKGHALGNAKYWRNKHPKGIVGSYIATYVEEVSRWNDYNLSDFLRKKGYDGIIDMYGKDGEPQYVVFDSSQVKLIESEDIVSKKEDKYNQYLDLHRGAVYQVYKDLLKLAEEWSKSNNLDENQNNPLTWILDNASTLDSMLKNHDISKYGKEEYDEYRKHFYPVDEQESLNSEGFKLASLHHVTNNPHHWENWCDLQDDGKYVLQEDINEHAYLLYVIERCCDEASMSQLYDNRVLDWYEENKHKMVVPEFSQQFYLDLLKIIQDNDLDVDEDNKNKFDSFKEKLDESEYTEKQNIFKDIKEINPNANWDNYKKMPVHRMLAVRQKYLDKGVSKYVEKRQISQDIPESRPKYITKDGKRYIAADDPAKGYNFLDEATVADPSEFTQDKSDVYVHTDNVRYVTLGGIPAFGAGYYLFNVNSVDDTVWKPSSEGNNKYYVISNSARILFADTDKSPLEFTEEHLNKLQTQMGVKSIKFDKDRFRRLPVNLQMQTLYKHFGRDMTKLMQGIGIDGIQIIDVYDAYDQPLKQETCIYNRSMLTEVSPVEEE